MARKHPRVGELGGTLCHPDPCKSLDAPLMEMRKLSGEEHERETKDSRQEEIAEIVRSIIQAPKRKTGAGQRSGQEDGRWPCDEKRGTREETARRDYSSAHVKQGPRGRE